MFTSKFADLKFLSNSKLEVARAEIVALQNVTHSDFKKVAALNAKGTALQKQREATIAQATHTLCPYFDDGVAVGVNTKDSKKLLYSLQINSGDSDCDKLFYSC